MELESQPNRTGGGDQEELGVRQSTGGERISKLNLIMVHLTCNTFTLVHWTWCNTFMHISTVTDGSFDMIVTNLNECIYETSDPIG